MAMSDNLQQLRGLAQPKSTDKVDQLTRKLAKQTEELAALPATRDKARVAQSLQSIFYLKSASITIVH